MTLESRPLRAAGPRYRALRADHLGLAERKVMAAVEACRTADARRPCRVLRRLPVISASPTTAAATATVQVPGAAARPLARGARGRSPAVGYFHVVFTLPTAVAYRLRQQGRVVYDLLFRRHRRRWRDHRRTIRSIWVRRSASPPCSTPGARPDASSPCPHDRAGRRDRS